MKKVLYCMHVGWNWIKQRPHFIAEELSKEYDVTVISDHNYRVKSVDNKSSECDTLHIKEFYKIPLLDHFYVLKKINHSLRKVFYQICIKKVKPDYIYLMTPNAVKYIPQRTNAKIIYDCMDDMVAFAGNEMSKKEVEQLERKLVQKADVIFVSSNNLRKTLINRYGYQWNQKMSLVRNGFNGKIYENQSVKKNVKDNYILCYFGTVAEWFNFEYIERSLLDIPKLEYWIIGPCQAGTAVVENDRIKYFGSVEHEKLHEYIAEADAFIMPFVVTELIESVDPVKLYEYINFNKNILCVKYDEIERFEEFVYFYTDYDSFVNQINKMKTTCELKYTQEKRNVFLKNNTWEYRAKSIIEVLNK